MKNEKALISPAELFKRPDNGEACPLCNDGETKCIISNQFQTDSGNHTVFCDVRLDLDFNQIDAQYGFLDSNGRATDTSTWTNSLNIHYCPVCGKELPPTV